MNELISLLISWLPVLILMVFVVHWANKRTNSNVSLVRESLELQKKNLACLEEIKAELKRR
jgi:hypothetical protein